MRNLLIILFVLFSAHSFSQSVGIGTPAPHASAALDVTSNSKGFLPPILTQSQRLAISNPADGLLVFDSTARRFYQYQDGSWRFIADNDLWEKSTTRRVIYNSSDSIGVGTFNPGARLEILGDMRARSNIRVAGNITASGSASGMAIVAQGSLQSGGVFTASGNLSGGGDLIVNNPSAIVQFQTGGVSKAFFQTAGDNLRLGTNSGNENGMTIIRMNGANVFQIDKQSNFTLLKPWVGYDVGNLIIGNKVETHLSAGNFLPVLYGQVYADGTTVSTWPQTGTVEKISTGVYEIDPHRSDYTSRGLIKVTPSGTTPRICNGRYTSGGKFRVYIYNMSGNPVDNNFYFLINDPL